MKRPLEEYYGHTKEGAPATEWQRLEAHLFGTARLAEQMAGEFRCQGWGFLSGLWHDLGKYSPAFQRYIQQTSDPDGHLEDSKPGRVDHSTAGALYAIQRLDLYGRLLAYIIVGHHAGLPDFESDHTGGAALSQRLKKKDLLDAALQEAPREILDRTLPGEKPNPGADPAFWIRLLFSCLVDADFLDTEDFLNASRATSRGGYLGPGELLALFTAYIGKKQAAAADTSVNKIRHEVLEQCIAAATGPPGFYTLTVPTGGGKTLSSMAFALHHAVKNSKRRIVYVIPYTSIIEQTADQFRDIFFEAIVEHQSNLDVSDPSRDNVRSRLACENWDAPVIVTTSVQFFESLFASRTSRCRKLHNIVNSVVIIDEAQLLPPDFLNPVLHVLTELQKNYGVTFLFSTATQPALGPHKTLDFDFKGLPAMREIVKNPASLHERLKRVEIELPRDMNEPRSWDELAAELSEHPSVLCIVNRRDDCRDLWGKMPEGTFHLSALMCGAHRSDKIRAIKQRMKQGVPTRVISTQLVEAGVDLDFPVVYRALAGLDSIAQAAGRCNREGRLPGKGKVVVFVPPSESPPGLLRQAAQIGQKLLSQKCADVLAPERFESFFRELYWLRGERLDAHHILDDLKTTGGDFRYAFRTAASKFRIIDDTLQAPVVVTYKDGAGLVKHLERDGPDRSLLRALQRYIVNVPRYLHARLLTEGSVREIHPGIFVQVFPSHYDEDLGFCPENVGPDDLIIS